MEKRKFTTCQERNHEDSLSSSVVEEKGGTNVGFVSFLVF